MTDWIGWVATAIFALSYIAKSAQTLRRVQAVAACLWIGYGVAVSAAPVVVANVIVAAVAVLSSRRKSGGSERQ